MKIYTSYFGNSRKLNASQIEIICIAIGRPRFVKCTQLIQVAPKRYMLDDKLSDEEYISMYNTDVLANVNPYNFVKLLTEISNTSKQLGKSGDVALCCYETPGKFCHRTFLAKWITEKTGIEVVEFGQDAKSNEESPVSTQIPLF